MEQVSPYFPFSQVFQTRHNCKNKVKHALFIVIFVAVFSMFLGGCAREDGRNLARDAQQYGFAPHDFDTASFVLFGMLRLPSVLAAPQESVLQVYIEGDGYAWQSRTRPSSDPTPHNPVSLRLALADRSGQPVLYLARPCQFVEGPKARMCRVNYWTAGRFAPEVIQSLSQAIDQAKMLTKAQRVALVGYSGGGGIAALLAAQRADVSFLGTIAGNLDHESWTTLHGVSPLRDSLNPLESAPQIRDLPQIHLSSTADSIIPPSISRKFCQAAQQPDTCQVIDKIGHNGAWEEIWETIRSQSQRKP